MNCGVCELLPIPQHIHYVFDTRSVASIILSRCRQPEDQRARTPRDRRLLEHLDNAVKRIVSLCAENVLAAYHLDVEVGYSTFVVDAKHVGLALAGLPDEERRMPCLENKLFHNLSRHQANMPYWLRRISHHCPVTLGN